MTKSEGGQVAEIPRIPPPPDRHPGESARAAGSGTHGATGTCSRLISLVNPRCVNTADDATCVPPLLPRLADLVVCHQPRRLPPRRVVLLRAAACGPGVHPSLGCRGVRQADARG